MRIPVIMMLAGVLCAAACGGGNDNESPRARVAEGTYDATVVRDGVPVETTGYVSFEPPRVSVYLVLGGDASVRFSGLLNDDSTVQGSGDFEVTDVLFSASAEATFSDNGGLHVITGSVVPVIPYGGFDQPVTFTMQRPADADASGLSGTYRFTLTPSPMCACTSTIDIDFTIDRFGNGRAETATELGPDGTAIASLTFPSISLSPQGKLQVLGSYVTTPPSEPATLVLNGSIRTEDTRTTASGNFFVRYFFMTGPGGTWSAARTQ